MGLMRFGSGVSFRRQALLLASTTALLSLWVACSSDDSASPDAGSGGAGGTQGSGGSAGEGDPSSSTSTTGGSGGDATSTDTGGGGSAGEPSEVPVEVVLDSLVVTGVQVPLKPVFAPTRQRYSVQAEPTAVPLVVTAIADPSLQIEIAGTPTESGEPLTLDDVDPDSEFSVIVSNAEGDAASYTVLYLPADFPNFQVRAYEPGASKDPIYLSTRNEDAYFAVKLSNDGVPLFYRRTDQPNFDFKKFPTGEVSYAEFAPNSTLAEHIVLDDTFTEVDRVTTVDLADTDEHEFVIQPNGNYIVLAYEPVVRDLTEFGRSATDNIMDGMLQELSPDHEVLFQWNTWDHMSFGDSTYLERDPRDYSHLNSVFVDDDGNWIVSSRGQAQVFKIDRDTGEVLWRLGGATNDFTFVNDPFGGLCGQHTASLTKEGHLLLFDNGQYCYPEVPERGELTRIVEYELDEDAMTAELVWSYSREGAYCVSQGSAERLDNGNTFIGWGIGTNLLATEVTPDGQIVYELSATALSGGVHSYRAWRFPD